jgi:hypothetical protein
VWGSVEVHTGFDGEIRGEKYYLEDIGVRKMILKWILNKCFRRT